MNEIWRTIERFPGYEVSNLGRIRNAKTGYIRKQRITPMGGYYSVVLKGNSYYVHRFVAEAFIENPNNLPCVNHKDESRTNNNADNLEWCTQGYNVQYGTAEKRRRETYTKNLSRNSIVRRVAQCDMNGNIIKIWPSISIASKTLCLDNSTISRVCSGSRNLKHCGGYKWKYV